MGARPTAAVGAYPFATHRTVTEIDHRDGWKAVLAQRDRLLNRYQPPKPLVVETRRWCNQCDRLRHHAEIASCTSPFCTPPRATSPVGAGEAEARTGSAPVRVEG